MDCHDCLERLYAFLDVELTEAERAQVRAHLEGCDDCPEHFEFEGRFLATLRDCCTSDVAPAELRRRVLTRLQGEAAPPS